MFGKVDSPDSFRHLHFDFSSLESVDWPSFRSKSPSNESELSGDGFGLNQLGRGSSSSSSSTSDKIGASKIVNSSRYKTELCRPYQEYGNCKYGEKCQFAHGICELKNVSRHPKYKTDLCKTYHSVGFCPYGPRCHFIHNLEEMKKSCTSQQYKKTSPVGSKSGFKSPGGLTPLPIFSSRHPYDKKSSSSSSSTTASSDEGEDEVDGIAGLSLEPVVRLPVFSMFGK